MENIKTYWRAYLNIGILACFMISNYVSTPPSSEATNGIAKITGLTLMVILSLQITESFDLISKFKKSRSDIQADLKSVLETADRFAVRIVEFKSNNDYFDLFGNLNDEFLSYNPHQFAHKSVILNEELIIENMRLRYRDPSFSHARFLLCIGDSYGKDNFCRFAHRLRKVANNNDILSKIRDKVIVKVSTRPYTPEAAFHLQKKEGINRTVVELRLSGLTVGDSPVPRHYLVTNTNVMRTHFSNYFEQEWAKANDVSIDIVFNLEESYSIQQVRIELEKNIEALR